MNTSFKWKKKYYYCVKGITKLTLQLHFNCLRTHSSNLKFQIAVLETGTFILVSFSNYIIHELLITVLPILFSAKGYFFIECERF